MRIRSVLGSSALCCLILSSSLVLARSQDRRDERQRGGSKTEVRSEQRTRTSSTTEVRRLSTVIGGHLIVEDGTFGDIEDIVISDSGCIDYVVVVYEDRFIPIPWSVVSVDFSKRVVHVDIAKARLLEAPHFAKNNWTELSKSEWTEKVTKHFGSSRREGGRPGDRRDEGTNRREESSKGKDSPKRDSKDQGSDESSKSKKSDKKSDEKKPEKPEKPEEAKKPQ